MSRLGKIPIPIPKGVEAKFSDKRILSVKGPKGSLDFEIKPGIVLDLKDSQILVSLCEKIKLPFSEHGLYRALINNMLIGVEKGFKKELTLIGVGYRAALKGNQIDLQVGFSHPTLIDVPKGLSIKINKSVEIVIEGPDKQQVGQFAARVRSIRKPEPYKGKGIRYKDEYVRKKAGKAAKAAK
ncbi:MAG: 50S ribosomal protein L6 [Candidatus Anoxychlamydiales bacterium]|nr:50S ribosomal protein L6 [Candidatus Anoxychlamydiales bacterium]NGX35334.1 50S ribosomal protein L6 [Candidatus Anoxychlamydiales bacterium]